MKPLIRAEGLSRRFAEREVVAGVSFELASAEFVALLGPSGCGKTTLLHMIGLLDRPSGGRVLLDGLDAWSLPARDRAALRLSTLGFVFQQSNLLEQLSLRENVALPAWKLLGSRSRALEKADAALDSLGLSQRRFDHVRRLSSGEAQRAAIARSIVNEPRVVLADEPSGNLDSVATESVLEAFAEVCAAGAALLVVTHDPSVAGRAARRLTLRDGRFQAAAGPEARHSHGEDW